jgi:hypothetical protein
MHAVGHVADRHLVPRPAGEQRLEEPPAHLPVQLADAVDATTRPDGEEGHVEHVFLGAGAEFQKALQRNPQFRGVLGQVFAHEVRGEPIEARCHRRVGGEDVPRPGGGHGFVEVDAVVLHVAAGALQGGEGRMALVEMTDLRLDAQRSQHPPASDAQDEFLLQPHLGAAAVQFAGDAPVGGSVHEVVGVEQVEHHSSGPHLPHT